MCTKTWRSSSFTDQVRPARAAHPFRGSGQGRRAVIETGRVNELQIENTGDEEVFVQQAISSRWQAGPRADRQPGAAAALRAVPIASFCVERRWSARAGEDTRNLQAPARRSRPAAPAPSAAPVPAQSEAIRPAGGPPSRSNETASRHSACGRRWPRSEDLSADSTRGCSPQSATSLQLSLENENLQQAPAITRQPSSRSG